MLSWQADMPSCINQWGAHLNVQRATGKDWSYYLVKHALTAEPIGNIHFDTAAAIQLGLQNLARGILGVIVTSLVLSTCAGRPSQLLGPDLALSPSRVGECTWPALCSWGS